MSDENMQAPNTKASNNSNAGRDPFPPRLEGERGEIKQNANDILEHKIAANERRAELSGIAVVVGLAFELISAFVFRDKKPWIEYWTPIISDAVITLGVAGEILFARKASAAQTVRQKLADERIAELNKLAGDANERAGEASARAAWIEQLTAWRRITPEQQKKLISLLKQRSDIDVLIEFERADPEAYTYAWDIAKIFLNSGFESAKVRFIGNSWLATGHFGVFMSFSLDYAQSISDGFAEAGIFHTVFGHDLATHLPRGVPAPNLYIFVAPKPPLKTLGDLGDIA